MRKFLEGALRFRHQAVPAKRELFERLANGQEPQALFISCSDSRVSPELVTQSQPGDLFASRNVGNLVPPYASADDSVSATIEAAVIHLGIRDIIVCGHSDCAAMKVLIEPEKARNMPRFASWLKHATPQAQHNTSRRSLKQVIEENVLVQLGNLRTHPSVASALARGELNLHGWVYEVHTGSIQAYSPLRRAFLSLEEAYGDDWKLSSLAIKEATYA